MGAIYNNNINRPIAIKLTGQEIIDASYSVSINELVSTANYGGNSLTALLDNQDEIQVVRRLYDYSAVSPLPTSAEMLTIRTLPNANTSGSSMYTINGNSLTFSEDDADYVWTTAMSGRSANVQLPGIVAGDIVYIMRKNVLALPIVRFQPGSRFTASSLNMAIDQVLYVAQEVHYLIENFGDLNPVMENLSEGICFLDENGYLQCASFNIMSTYINAGDGLVWTTEAAGSTTADLLDVSIANAGTHGTLQFLSGGLSLNPLTDWTDDFDAGSMRAINGTLAKGLYTTQVDHAARIAAAETELADLASLNYKGTLDVDEIDADSEPVSPDIGDIYDIIEADDSGTEVNIGPASGGGVGWNTTGDPVNLSKGDQVRWDGTIWKDVFHSPYVRLDGTLQLTDDWDSGVGSTNYILVPTQGASNNTTRVANTAHVKLAMAAQTTMAALTTANALISATSLASLPALALTALGDVDSTADDVTGNFLKWDGAKWVGDDTPIDSLALQELSDVSTFTPGHGDALLWDAGTSLWYGNPPGSSADLPVAQTIGGANADGVTDDAALVQTKLDLVGTSRKGSEAQSTPTMKSTLDLQGRTFMVEDGVVMWGNSNITIQNGTLNHKHPTSSFGSCIRNSHVWGDNDAGYYTHDQLQDYHAERQVWANRNSVYNSSIGVEILDANYGAGKVGIRVPIYADQMKAGDYVYIHDKPTTQTDGEEARLEMILGSSEMGTAYRGEWNIIEWIDDDPEDLQDTDDDGGVDDKDTKQVDTTKYYTIYLRHPLKYEYQMYWGGTLHLTCYITAIRTLTNTNPPAEGGENDTGLAQHNITFKNLHIKETAHRFFYGEDVWENSMSWDGAASLLRASKPFFRSSATVPPEPNHKFALSLGWGLKVGDDGAPGGAHGSMLVSDVGPGASGLLTGDQFPDSATRWTHPVCAMNGVVPTATGWWGGDDFRDWTWHYRWNDFNNTELFLMKSEENEFAPSASRLLAQIWDSDYKHSRLFDHTGDSTNTLLTQPSSTADSVGDFQMYGTDVMNSSAYDSVGEVPWNPGVISFHCNAGIHYRYAYDLVFEDCVFEGNAYGGVVLDGCTNVKFRNCTFRNSRWANVQDPSKGAGIVLNGCEKVLVDGCTFENCNSGVVLGSVNTHEYPMGNPTDTSTTGINPFTEKQHCADITITNCVFDGVSRGVVNQNSLTLVVGMTVSDCVFNMRPGNEKIFHLETTGFSTLDPETGIAARGISLNGYNITLRGNQIHGSVNYKNDTDEKHLRLATGAWYHNPGNPAMLSGTSNWPFGLSQDAIDLHLSDDYDSNKKNTSFRNIAACDTAIQVCIQGQPLLAYESGSGNDDNWGNATTNNRGDCHRREESTLLGVGGDGYKSWGNLYKQSFGCKIEGNSVEAFGTGIFVVPRNQRGDQGLTGDSVTPPGYEMGVVKGIHINNNNVKANLHGIQVWAGSPSLARVMSIHIKDNDVLFGGFLGYVPAVWGTEHEGEVFNHNASNAVSYYPKFHNFAGNLFDFGGYPVNWAGQFNGQGTGDGEDRNKIWDAESSPGNDTSYSPVPHAPSGTDAYLRYNRFSKHEFYKPRYELNALAPGNSSGIMINVVRETEREMWGNYVTTPYPANYLDSDGVFYNNICLVQDTIISGNTVNANFRYIKLSNEGIGSLNMRGCIQLGLPISPGTASLPNQHKAAFSVQALNVSNNVCRGYEGGVTQNTGFQTGIGIPYIYFHNNQYPVRLIIRDAIFSGNAFSLTGREDALEYEGTDLAIVHLVKPWDSSMDLYGVIPPNWSYSTSTYAAPIAGCTDHGGLRIAGWSGGDMSTWRQASGSGLPG